MSLNSYYKFGVCAHISHTKAHDQLTSEAIYNLMYGIELKVNILYRIGLMIIMSLITICCFFDWLLVECS